MQFFLIHKFIKNLTILFSMEHTIHIFRLTHTLIKFIIVPKINNHLKCLNIIEKFLCLNVRWRRYLCILSFNLRVLRLQIFKGILNYSSYISNNNEWIKDKVDNKFTYILVREWNCVMWCNLKICINLMYNWWRLRKREVFISWLVMI